MGTNIKKQLAHEQRTMLSASDKMMLMMYAHRDWSSGVSLRSVRGNILCYSQHHSGWRSEDNRRLISSSRVWSHCSPGGRDFCGIFIPHSDRRPRPSLPSLGFLSRVGSAMFYYKSHIGIDTGEDGRIFNKSDRMVSLNLVLLYRPYAYSKHNML